MTAPSVIIPAGILALVIVCLAADRLMGPDWTRTRLAAWCSGWLLIGAALALAAGMRRAGGLGLRKLAARLRAALRTAPDLKAAPRTGKHRTAAAR